MLILINNLFGERFWTFVLELLEKMAISFWQVAGATIIMVIGIAICLSTVVNVTIHFGGFTTFVVSTIIGIIVSIFAIKWLLLFLVLGVPALIIVFGIHRNLRRNGVSPTLRGLFLWAAILLII